MTQEPNTTEAGINHILKRFDRCETLEQLARIWGNLSFAYQRDTVILQAKDDRKAALSAQLTNQGVG